MAKIALLVLSHKPESTQYLLDLLDNRFAVFIHMDARVSLAERPLRLPANAKLTATRLPVFWGGFNMVLATRILIAEAKADNPQFERYVLISGDALPTAALDKIEAALLDPMTEYIDLAEVENDPSLRHLSHAETRKKYRWVQPWHFQNYTFWDHVLAGPRTEKEVAEIYNLGPDSLQKIRHDVHFLTEDILRRIPPRPSIFEKFYYGSQWWALSGHLMNLIYDEMFDPNVENFFALMAIPDEHFFHCLVGRSLPALAKQGTRVLGTIMFTDHADPVRASFGDDALLGEKFLNNHKMNGKLFARKFDPKRAPEIAKMISEKQYFSRIAT